MLEFAEADPDVLSRDYTVHLTKVLTQSYAYIGDSPVVEIWAAEHCDVTMLPVKLTGMEYYSILLPKDSVITDVVNKVYVILAASVCLTICLFICLSDALFHAHRATVYREKHFRIRPTVHALKKNERKS